MSTQVKHRRGTTAEIAAGTPAIGELWFNTTDNTIHMGDGVTPGGNKHVNINMVDILYKSSPSTSAVSNMIADNPFRARVGDVCTTGGTLWKRTNDAANDISDFTPLGSVDVADFDADQSDAALFINEVINLGYDVKTSLQTCNTSTPIIVPSTAGDIDFSGMEIVSSSVTPWKIGTVGANPYNGVLTGFNTVYDGLDTTGQAYLFENFTGSMINPSQTNYATGYALKPISNSRVAYCTFYNPKSINHITGVIIQPQDITSYANENTFFGGRMGPFSAEGRLGYQIDIDNQSGTGAQHNRFLGTSIEGWSASGVTGIASVRCRNGSDSNVFMWCRPESYNSGWSSGYAYNLSSGTECQNNIVYDNLVGTLVLDGSGKNNYHTSMQGSQSRLHPNSTDKAMVKITRSDPVTSKYALDYVDEYTSSGTVKFLSYKTPRSDNRNGDLVNLDTGYGVVFHMDEAGTITPRDNFSDIGSVTNRYREIYSVDFYATTYNASGQAGASGTFTSNDGKTITVSGGIIIGIV